jgi:hypothetical protein
MYTIEQLKSFIETTDPLVYGDLARQLAKELLEQRELNAKLREEAEEAVSSLS